MTASLRLRAGAVALAAAIALAATTARAAHGDITLVGQIALPNADRITDVWGYSDGNGNRYALVGDWFLGVHIVDVTDPANPSYVTLVTGVPGFDVKAWKHYVYTCDGGYGNVSRVVDILNVQAPAVLPATFRTTHNIAISDAGIMYTEYPGLQSYDLNADPANPDSLWANPSNGHDSTPRGDLLLDFTGTDAAMTIWDVSDPSAPVVAATISDPSVNYYHSGDMSADGDYLYICDELATDPEPDIIVWNVSNFAAPFRVGDLAEPSATVHNLYVVGDLAFVSHYTAGFRTLDLTDPANPVVADTYDTSGSTGEGYNGAFGVYPYADDGLVFVSDHPNGLYIFSVEGYNGPPTAVRRSPAVAATLGQNVPNPFNPATTIEYSLDAAADITLEVFDVRGTKVRTLVRGMRGAGTHRVEWNGSDRHGERVASGVYYYRLRGSGADLTRKMVLLK